MIYKLLASYFFSYYFVNIAGIPQAIKRIFKFKFGQRLKPLDCVTCLSVWIGCIMYFVPLEFSQFICLIFGAGYLGYKIQ